jgi:hypothetical protein
LAVSVIVARSGLPGSSSETELMVLSTRRLLTVLDVRALPALSTATARRS